MPRLYPWSSGTPSPGSGTAGVAAVQNGPGLHRHRAQIKFLTSLPPHREAYRQPGSLKSLCRNPFKGVGDMTSTLQTTRAPRTCCCRGGWPAALALARPVIQHFEGLRQTGYGDRYGRVPKLHASATGPVAAIVGHPYSIAGARPAASTSGARATISPTCIKVPVPANSYAAFVSFAFNVGPAAFCRSTRGEEAERGRPRRACACPRHGSMRAGRNGLAWSPPLASAEGAMREGL